ncbi:MerR family transcriptional regulator [Psychrobacter pygoscelis]|uniref:MerR family transcriptional regulator n=1 Tax=Psychrobacter pygoscelis TaxID=2488563 RepID=UPI00103E7952|nr:MerR family transcriptional regulator [Psychrobacter pygoscelis]
MNSDIHYLLIGQLARAANTTKDTIRHYDELGLLKSRKRQAGSRLYTEYHPECIERIELIKGAQTIGFKLNEIKNGLNDYYDGTLDIDEQIQAISAKLEQAKRQQLTLTTVIGQLNERLIRLKQMKSDNYQMIRRSDCPSPSEINASIHKTSSKK